MQGFTSAFFHNSVLWQLLMLLFGLAVIQKIY